MRWLPWALVVLVGAVLAGALWPWVDCDLCSALEIDFPGGDSDGVDCPFCRDRRVVSPFRHLGGRRPHPRLAALVRAQTIPAATVAALPLLQANGLDAERELRAGTSSVFFDTSAGWRGLLASGGDRGHPLRVYLFDEDARLLDRWEFRSAAPDLSLGIVRERTAIVIVLYDPERLPPTGDIELSVEGQPARKLGPSPRIDLSGGRLALAP